MRPEFVALPADWDDFVVTERFDFRKWVRKQDILPVGPYIRPRAQAHPLAQFLVGWISGLALVKGGVIAATNYQEQVLKDTPVGYWRMDQIVQNDPQLDISGEPTGPRNQFEISDPILNQAGLLFSDTPNLSCGFDGVDDRFFASQVSFWPNAQQPISVECWCQRDNIVVGNASPVTVETAGNDLNSGRSCRITMDGPSPADGRITVQRGANSFSSFPTVGFTDDLPHHIVMTAPGGGVSDVRMFIDGIDFGVDADAANPGSQTTAQVNIGARRGSSASFHWRGGEIDEVAVYDFELSLGQVLQHFNAGDSGAFT